MIPREAIDQLVATIIPKADRMYPALFGGEEHGTLLILEPGSILAALFDAPELRMEAGRVVPPNEKTVSLQRISDIDEEKLDPGELVAVPWFFMALTTRDVVDQLRRLLEDAEAVAELCAEFLEGVRRLKEQLEKPPPRAGVYVVVAYGGEAQVGVIARQTQSAGPAEPRTNAPGGSA